MFGGDDRSIAAYLMQAERYAVDACHFDQNAAQRVLMDIISNDRRFDQFDPARLAARVAQHRHNGAVLDLTDPALRPGSTVYSPLKRV